MKKTVTLHSSIYFFRNLLLWAWYGIPVDLNLSIVKYEEKVEDIVLTISGKKKCVQSTVKQVTDFGLAQINVSIFMFTETDNFSFN